MLVYVHSVTARYLSVEFFQFQCTVEANILILVFLMFYYSDRGLMESLSQTLYITHANDCKVILLDEKSKPYSFYVDTDDLTFKLAVLEHKYYQVSCNITLWNTWKSTEVGCSCLI